jgi:hypothetical protein
VLISSQLEVNLRGGETYEEKEVFDVDDVVSRMTMSIEVRPRAYSFPECVSDSSDRYVFRPQSTGSVNPPPSLLNIIFCPASRSN